MSHAEGEADPALHGKAGRNEARKLRPTWMNILSVAFFVAASTQPVIGVLQQGRPFALAEVWAAAIFLMISVALFVAAQSVVKRMED